MNTIHKGDRRSGAIFSADGLYRYALWRRWELVEGSVVRALVVIGLNPSTADEHVDDPTIRRCVAFAKRERCGRLVMLNLFALRATDPREMLRHPDPVGPENDAVIGAASSDAQLAAIIAAWGAHGAHRDRDRQVALWLDACEVRLHCLGLTKDGHPRHPLRLRADMPLEPFRLRARP